MKCLTQTQRYMIEGIHLQGYKQKISLRPLGKDEEAISVVLKCNGDK